jgi:predicted SnoaL-like aldol condensation-catalyzing enzyme
MTSITAANTTMTQANRDIAVDFLRQAAHGHARDAMRRYGAPDFVHHNPYFASDADTLAKAMDDNARSNPDKQFEVLRTISEGPLVAVHSRVRMGHDAPEGAVVHILRIEDGRIHELWDVGQDAPPDSPNSVGMF